MKMSSENAIRGFKDSYQKWAQMRRENRLVRGDVEPDGRAFGLHPSIVRYLKSQIDKEVNR